MRTFPLFTLFILAIAWLAHPASAAPLPASPDFTAVDSYVAAQMQAATGPFAPTTTTPSAAWAGT